MDDVSLARAAGPLIRALDPLAGRYLSGSGIVAGPASSRDLVSLRVAAGGVAAVGAALGVDLPMRPKTSASGETLSALWLGPDEWLLIAPVADPASEGGAQAIIETVEASGTAEQSAVDVSHRFVAIALEGPAVEAVLAACCPQDLRLQSFPVAACSRTIFAKAEIVLWRRGETAFDLVCLRSFGDYVWALLTEAARSPAV